jgi:hypothetical protein
MTDRSSLLKALVIYAICLPLAIFLGYLLASPQDMSSEAVVGGLLAALAFPLLLRWHHAMLVLSWNMVAMAFFLPGRPPLFFPLCALSLLLAILHFVLHRKQKFISVPSLTWPMVFLVVVVVATAELTGGMGLKAFGGAAYGGKKYVYIFGAIAGYFALASRAVAPRYAPLYIKLYFLSSLSMALGRLITIISPGFYFIFLIFPPDWGAWLNMTNDPGAGGLDRLGGLSIASSSTVFCMLALYGIQGIFDVLRPWRMIVFVGLIGATLLGGYRSFVLLIGLCFCIQFYLEGLHRSRLLPVFVLVALIVAVCTLPFVNQLPQSAQRALSFVPGLQVDPLVKADAEGSTDWRLNMWARVWPEVPSHLLLGKGYGENPAEMDAINMAAQFHAAGLDPFEGSMLAGDYHSGPLSLVMPFGVWGVAAFLWLLCAGVRVLYLNYACGGDRRLHIINTMLLAYFITKSLAFFFIFGSLFSDISQFTGILGLSVCLNGGVRVRVRAPAREQLFHKFRFAGARPRSGELARP